MKTKQRSVLKSTHNLDTHSLRLRTSIKVVENERKESSSKSDEEEKIPKEEKESKILKDEKGSKILKDEKESKILKNEKKSKILKDEKEMTVPIVRPSFLQRLASRFFFLKYVPFLLILPILNYGSIQREDAVLVSEEDRVDMGWGQKMFINCKGEGFPTVILDAPNGMTSDVWVLAQQQLAEFTKVCVYDRSGLGFSDLPFTNQPPGGFKQKDREFVAQTGTLEQMTSDLHHLVNQAKPLPHPLILVGSEIGGLVARHYAHLHPKDVSDVVLLDPFVENLFSKNDEWEKYWYTQLLPSLRSQQVSSIIGLSRIAFLTGMWKPMLVGKQISEDVILRQKRHLCSPTHTSSVFNEHLYINTSFNQMRKAWELKRFPQSVGVTVVNSKQHAKFPAPLHKAWEESQLYLQQTLHPGCMHITIDDEDYLAFYKRPTTFVEHIRYIVRRWRYKHGMLSTYTE